MRKLMFKFFMLISVFTLVISGSFTVSANLEANEFIILHTNDVHGQIDGSFKELALLKSYKNYVKADYLFDAGDSSQGLPLSNLTKGESLAKIYNEIGFDAVTLGNHEFDFTRDAVLAKEPGFFSMASFPIISSNIYFDENAFANEVEGTAVFDTSTVIKKTINNEEINMSVFGLTTPETKFKADPRNSEGMEFRDPYDSIKKELLSSTHDDSDYIVILAHLGIDTSTKEEWRGDYLANRLANDMELLNRKIIIIDGHSHSEVENGRFYGDNVLYGQTGGKLESIGEMRINLDDFSKSVLRTIKLKKDFAITGIFKDLLPDAAVETLIAETISNFDSLAGYTVLDNLDFDLNGHRDYTRTRETNLGRLITDSMYTYAKTVFSNTDLAVINGGGIRDSIKSGRVLFKDLLTALPFGNRVVQIDVTGEQLYEMFEHSLSSELSESSVDDNNLPTLESNPSVLHVSESVNLRFDPRLPKGSRVQSIEINNEKVDLTKVYKLATIEFLAIGGDGFTMLKGAREEGGNDADILRDYLLSSDIDLERYRSDKPERVVSIANFEKIAFDSLSKLIVESSMYNNDDLQYTEESYNKLLEAQAKALIVLNDLDVKNGELTSVTYAEYEMILNDLREAIADLKEMPNKPPLVNDDKHDNSNNETSERNDVDTGVSHDNSTYSIVLITSLIALIYLRKIRVN